MLTEPQRQTLAAHIRANQDAAVVAALAIRNDVELARLYNLPAAPSFYIWRTEVAESDILSNGFDWVRVDNLTVGKARIWEWLFGFGTRTIDATKSNIRAGIAECWKGTAADLAVRQVVFNHCQKQATVAEKLFATGAGTASDVNGSGPAIGAFVGDISIDDVSYALNRY